MPLRLSHISNREYGAVVGTIITADDARGKAQREVLRLSRTGVMSAELGTPTNARAILEDWLSGLLVRSPTCCVEIKPSLRKLKIYPLQGGEGAAQQYVEETPWPLADWIVPDVVSVNDRANGKV